MKSKLSIDKKTILGHGAFGTVFQGTWDGKSVAVKRILIDDPSDQIREEAALKTLDHPILSN